MLLPCAVAHYGHGRGAGLIVLRRDGASGENADTECLEIIPRDKFAHIRFRRSSRAATACAHILQARLERSHLAELGCVSAELLVESVRVNGPVVLHAADHATIILVPDAVELFGI